MSIHPDAAEIAGEVQAAQGWTDATLLEVILEYINNQDDNDAFAEYLDARFYDFPGSTYWDERKPIPFRGVTNIDTNGLT